MPIMKSTWLIFLLMVLLVLLRCEAAWCTYQREYLIEVHADCSASWIIEHRIVLETEEDQTVFRQYSNMAYFSHFMEDMNALLNGARMKTGRENMSIPMTSFKLTVSFFDSYRVIKYEFYWTEFAEREGSYIRIGDVFENASFFFLGDGELRLVYPAGYDVESVSPGSVVKSDRTLTWNSVAVFNGGEPNAVFRSGNQSFIDVLRENAFQVIGLITLVGLGFFSLWFFKFRKARKIVVAKPVSLAATGIVEDEEKVISLLKGAGGSLYQSDISDKLGFSRSKTSKLLALMENKGRIRRVKKGRERVVELLDESKSVQNGGAVSS